MARFASNRWLAVGALVPALLVVGFDATILNLALPELATGLRASSLQLQWCISSYTLVFAASMIPGGMLGDRYGRKRLLLIALIIFGGASLACAYATSPVVFILERAVLGAGAAVVLPMVLGVIPALFNEDEQPKAIAVVMTTTILGFPIGPILGGWLLTHYWWGSVFLINVPVVLLAVLAVFTLLPETRSSRAPRLDPMGIVTSSAGLTALVYGVIEAGQYGWSDVHTVVPLLIGVAVLAAFVFWEMRVPEPLVDLTLFRSPGFTWGTVLSTVVNFIMFGVLFVLPQYFQGVLKSDAMGSGFRLLPLVGGLLIGAAIADRLSKLAGAKIAGGLGFALLAGGLVIGASTTAGSSYSLNATWVTISGIGLGFSMPTVMAVAIGTLSKDNSGVGSAVIQAVRMVGGSFGSALLGSLLYSGYRSRLDVSALPAQAAHAVRQSPFAGLALAQKLRLPALAGSIRSALVHGMDVMLLTCGGLGVVCVVLAVIFMPGREREGAGQPVDRPESAHGHLI